ncbi:Protein kti12 [Tolypocladium paradoxum]|uniref:Protein kti12 n=1 Tax=Tolypocladium paradoxum TaxID=94208 RepID=A0A2S4L0V8_9HYPO|nr:Protein kti12 [Tolypocladium paradoxum]
MAAKISRPWSRDDEHCVSEACVGAWLALKVASSGEAHPAPLSRAIGSVTRGKYASSSNPPPTHKPPPEKLRVRVATLRWPQCRFVFLCPSLVSPSTRSRGPNSPANASSQLIIVTGLPTSGKSTRARQLHDYLAERIVAGDASKYRLHLISDDSLSISRAVYDLSPSAVPAHTRSANASEKDARAALYGAVKRVLSDRDFVILDSLNYIKGWRYQLHCEAKAVRTPNCILQIGCSVDRARKVNEERLQKQQQQPQSQAEKHQQEENVIPEGEHAEAYEPANWDNLVFRYEEPNPMTRWDSPLFTLVWDDDEAQTRKTFGDLWDALAGDGRPVVRPNQSTVQRGRDAGGDYLYVLDRETQDIVKRILEQQAVDGGVAGQVKVPLNSPGREDLLVELPTGKKLSVPQLQRLRRAFIGLNRGGIGLESVGNMAADGLRETFVRYLNDSFEKDE